MRKVRMSVAGLLVFAAVLALGSVSSSAPGENAIVHWSGIAESAISAGRPPASSTVLAAMVHGAMYDAVAAVEGGLEPFATAVKAPPEASADAAVAQAARDVLVARVPGQAGPVQVAFDTYMAAIPAGPAKAAARPSAPPPRRECSRGGRVTDDVVPYVQPPVGPGVFEPIAATPVVDVKLGNVRPFTYGSQSEYRPDEPYELTSKRYAQDVNELLTVGRADSTTTRTAEQTDTVRFFTDQTFVQYSRGMRTLADTRGLDVRESARLLGYVWVAAADTMIACWEAKFHYYLWRPNHAIQRADTDDNPATSADPTWLPLVTGNHPEYPSGHACMTAAVTKSLQRYFGTKKVEWTLTSVVTGGTRTYERLGDLVEDVENARVWGGLHYRTTMTETAKHFPRIARDVGKEYFLAHDNRDNEDEDDD